MSNQADQTAEFTDRMKRFLSQEAAALRILLVYLFGSQALGQGGPLSDYDVAVLFSEEPPAQERYALQHRLTMLLDAGLVDLVVLNRAPVELQYGVIAAGRLVYEADRATRVEFEACTLSRYFDYLPVLRRQRRELLDEVSNEAGIQRYRAALRSTQRVLAQARATEEQAKG